MSFKSFFIGVSLFAFGFASSAGFAQGQAIDQLPMYGQPEIKRPDVLKKADEEFVRTAAAGIGSREAASQAWFAQAEEFMRAGRIDEAMRRYNQSWLLNPNNYQPYWGFGQVLVERAKPEEAIKHLEKAKQLVEDRYQKPALLTDLGTAYSQQAIAGGDRMEYFRLANQSFSEASYLDDNYGNAYRRWAMSLFEEGKFAEAKEKVKEAQARKARPFPPAFLKALSQQSD